MFLKKTNSVLSRKSFVNFKNILQVHLFSLLHALLPKKYTWQNILTIILPKCQIFYLDLNSYLRFKAKINKTQKKLATFKK